MFEVKTFVGVRVAICEDIQHVVRIINRYGLSGYSIRTKYPWDALDEYTNVVSGVVQ